MAALDPYLPPEARDARLRALAEGLGGEVVSFGESVEGRPLLAARVPARTPDAPTVLCAAAIHGVEAVASHVALAFLEALGAGPAAVLREEAEVWVAPALNPDAQARTFEVLGRAKVSDLRKNARGVDLNRNFPLPGNARPSRIPFAGSARRSAATYRGPVPFSEPETRAIEALLARGKFHALASLHSTMGTFIPARVVDREPFEAYARLHRALAGAQRFPYRLLHSRTFDVFTGELEDHAHHHHRAWAACVEVYPLWADAATRLGATAFWRFNPRRPDLWAANDVPALAAYFRAALALPRPDGGL
ncbi:MAG: M14 family metallopeptidase [Anaeromyxobacteraceae bacterium]